MNHRDNINMLIVNGKSNKEIKAYYSECNKILNPDAYIDFCRERLKN